MIKAVMVPLEEVALLEAVVEAPVVILDVVAEFLVGSAHAKSRGVFFCATQWLTFISITIVGFCPSIYLYVHVSVYPSICCLSVVSVYLYSLF